MAEKEMLKLNTGTTTVGLIGKDAVVLAADQQSNLGNIKDNLTVSKIYKINDKVALTIAGGVGDALAVVRFMKSHAKMYELEREYPLTPKAAMTLLANVLNGNRYYPFMAFFILGGFNGKGELYSSDLVGGYNPVDKFTSTGSGFELAYGYLEDQYKEGLPTDKLIETAVKAVKVAKRRDINTGGESISVFVISKDGVRELTKKELEKYIA